MTKQQPSRNNIIAYSNKIDGEWYDFNCHRLNTKIYFDELLKEIKNKSLESKKALNIILSETDRLIKEQNLDMMIISLNKLIKLDPHLANDIFQFIESNKDKLFIYVNSNIDYELINVLKTIIDQNLNQDKQIIIFINEFIILNKDYFRDSIIIKLNEFLFEIFTLKPNFIDDIFETLMNLYDNVILKINNHERFNILIGQVFNLLKQHFINLKQLELNQIQNKISQKRLELIKRDYNTLNKSISERDQNLLFNALINQVKLHFISAKEALNIVSSDMINPAYAGKWFIYFLQDLIEEDKNLVNDIFEIITSDNNNLINRYFENFDYEIQVCFFVLFEKIVKYNNSFAEYFETFIIEMENYFEKDKDNVKDDVCKAKLKLCITLLNINKGK